MHDTEQTFRSPLRGPTRVAGAIKIGAKRAKEKAFTLIELMVVVSVIAISASIAFTAINPNVYSNAANDFSEEIAATLIRARDLAIDEQVVVTVSLSPTTVEVQYTQIDLQNQVEQQIPVSGYTRDRFGGNKLDDQVCILSTEPLLYAPSEAGNAQSIPQLPCPPTSGIPNKHTTIQFQPDGTSLVETIASQGFTDFGWTVVVQDTRGGRPDYHLIQIFPTGLIRRVINVDNSAE
jgi:prepilin-type N-terminal cleavage/methylation domain-containing protein